MVPTTRSQSLPVIYRLLLDTHAEFTPTLPPNAPSAPKESTKFWIETPAAIVALGYLPLPEEIEKCYRFFRPSDAALSLASSLLKHVAIARATGTPWLDTKLTQERHIANGKPYFAPGGVEFNVSHHGRLAVLAYAEGGKEREDSIPPVGVDVVHIDLPKASLDVPRSGGWRSWSSIFSDAFSPAEMERIASSLDTKKGETPPSDLLEPALRLFYTYWALKEAYIKMTSEAFMADWLRELEFRNVRPPKPADGEIGKGEGREKGPDEDGRWAEGETVRDIEVWLKGKRVEGVQIEVQAVGKWYMVATAVKCKAEVKELQPISVKGDIEPLYRAC